MVISNMRKWYGGETWIGKELLVPMSLGNDENFAFFLICAKPHMEV
jgi:hypothetical protein